MRMYMVVGGAREHSKAPRGRDQSVGANRGQETDCHQHRYALLYIHSIIYYVLQELRGNL